MKALATLLLFTAVLAVAQNTRQIDSLHQQLTSVASDTGRIDLMNEIARAYLSSNPDTALVLAQEAKNRAVEASYLTGHAEALRIAGIAFDNKGEFEKALENFSRSRELFQKAHNPSGVAKCYNDIGIILYEQSRYDSALKCLFVSQRMKDSLGENVAAVYNNLALVYHDLGEFDNSLEYLYKTLSIDERAQDKQGMADSYLNIGTVHSENGENEKALGTLNQALALQHETGDKQGMVSTYRELGKLFNKDQRTDSALSYYKKALAIAMEINLQLQQSSIYREIGGVDEELNNLQEAFWNYNQALTTAKQIGEPRELIESQIGLGRVCTRLRYYEKAEGYLKQAVALAEQTGYKSGVRDSYRWLADLYQQKNDFRNAYKYQVSFSEVKDSLSNVEMQNRIIHMNARYESKKKDEQIAVLDAQNRLQESENRKQVIYRNALIAGSAMLLILALVLYNRYRFKNRTGRELREKNVIIEDQKAKVEAAFAELQRSQQQLVQSEKMATLGTLAAGVAHELNNPAAAANRASQQLQQVMENFERAREELNKLNLTPEEKTLMMNLAKTAREAVTSKQKIGALEMVEREAEIEDWLEEMQFGEVREHASSLGAMGFDKTSLEKLSDGQNMDTFKILLLWAAHVYPMHTLISDIKEGTGRISEIVGALKNYSYLDKAPVQDIDIHEGIENTLIILRSKLKNGITVKREYAEDIPRITAYGSELNQVWSNILDNAISAMNGKGEIIIRTCRQQDTIEVEIQDNGPGIPENIQTRIFDPFFTTKPPGKGTGLGLSTSYSIVVDNHKGNLAVQSRPGQTVFRVRLPISISA